ncbi:jg27198 [Pararge aegeria aegeria]|uniref:Jg27198 protein n=1 Tax=Pararge aegeria aegeria TaxID=348720 RepID=A0A8S4QEC4_9NEOP|nr:jg27198 [Pararge aegeria aegeria]
MYQLIIHCSSTKITHVNISTADPKRPWRTNSNKEKLLRIENELKNHIEKSATTITPMDEQQMKDLVKECLEETLISPPVNSNRLRDTVDEARRNLPNFQYRTIENSTATTILPQAHSSGTTSPTAEVENPKTDHHHQ